MGNAVIWVEFVLILYLYKIEKMDEFIGTQKKKMKEVPVAR